MDDLERQYLSMAYELAMKDLRRGFHEDAIAARFDLGYGPESDEDLIANITSDLMGRGYVETDMVNHHLGRVALRLTAAGKEEAERLADPVEQRKELRRDFLRAVYEQADGSPTGDVHWTELASRFGYAEMQMPPKQIEGIADQLAGMGFITIGAEEGAIYRITAKGVDEVEDNTPQDTGTTFQFYGNVQGSVIGTHNTAELTNTFDFRAIGQRIEEEGGEDKEELRQALALMQRLLERGEYLDRGALSRFSCVMEKHSWFTGSVTQALLGFATQAAG
jgi:DNA-binding PadR family transcriptional regulator